LTVPVAILFPPEYVHCETRRVLKMRQTARTPGTALVERTLDPYNRV